MPNDPSHIAIHIHYFSLGGIERMVSNLLPHFIARGLRVDLVLNIPGCIHLWNIPPEVRIVNLKARNPLVRLPRLIKYLRRERPFAMLSANHYANEVAVLAKRLARAPTRIVVSERNNVVLRAKQAHPLHLRRLTPLAARLFYPRADAVVTVSRQMATDLSDLTGLPIERITTIYSPINPELPDKVTEPLEHPWFDSGALPVVLAAGRMEDQKDYPTLIRAFALVKQARPARLIILGEGSRRAQLEALVHELGLQDDVQMPGQVANPYAYMARSQAFVLSSRWEGLPNAVIEALAAGVPVISTDCKTGPSELLDNGRYGELIPVGEPATMAQAILKVLSGNIKTVDASWLSQFSVEYSAQQYLDVLGVTAR